MPITAQFKRIILVASTGSGKTVIASVIIKDYIARYRKVLVLAHRREIVRQTRAKLRQLGVWCGVIQAAPTEWTSCRTRRYRWPASRRCGRVPCAATGSNCRKLTSSSWTNATHATARTWRTILHAYPEVIIVGLTATPCRGDGRGLGGIFETMIECPQVAELIKLGYLVPSRVYAPEAPNLDGVETRQGDYVVSQLEERMNKDKLVADIVTQWLKHGEGKKIVVFATGVGHSIHVRDRFIEAGIKAEHIDGGTPKEERDSTLARLAAGEITVVCNCMVLTEGWDMPEVSCCILARPTKQMGLYRATCNVRRPGTISSLVLDPTTSGPSASSPIA